MSEVKVSREIQFALMNAVAENLKSFADSIAEPAARPPYEAMAKSFGIAAANLDLPTNDVFEFAICISNTITNGIVDGVSND